MRTTGMLVAALALAGCATQFTGAPKVQNGPAGCKATCDQWGMELAGMVKMGEYSDGCICQQRPSQASTPSDGASAPSADRSGAGPGSAMGTAAVTGVYLQMQAVAAAAAAQQAAAASAASRQTGE